MDTTTSRSFNHRPQDPDLQNSWNADLGLSTTDRRMAFSRQPSLLKNTYLRQPSFQQQDDFSSTKPFLSPTVSSTIDMPSGISQNDRYSSEPDKFSFFRALRYGNRQMKRLFLMISLNVAYSTVEMAIGLFTGRVGMVSIFVFIYFSCFCLYVCVGIELLIVVLLAFRTGV